MSHKLAKHKAVFTPDEKNLLRRYLIWWYKMTKEELDRIDRKFTQLHVDRFVQKSMIQSLEKFEGEDRLDFDRKLEEFAQYIDKKECQAKAQKFSDADGTKMKSEYFFLLCRLKSIEEAIGFFLGVSALPGIKKLYEQEMTCRILQSREHT